jgi:hypothetical protein
LATKSSTSSLHLLDVLAAIGFGDRARLHALMKAWTAQLRHAGPDVVVAISAPVAWLVGPNIAPTLATGSGATLPVSTDGGFGRLPDDGPSVLESAVLEANVNSVLGDLGFQPIGSLPKIFERCQQWHYGLDWLDPYLPYRQFPSVGLLGPMPQDAGGPVESRLSILLDANYPNIKNLLLALAGLAGIKIDLFIKEATAAMHNFLSAQPGITLWDRFDTALAQVPKSRVIVHNGAPMLATIGVAAGRPHLVLPWTSEQMLTLAMLKQLGVVWWKDADCSLAEIAETLQAVLKDQGIGNKAICHQAQLVEDGIDNALLTISAAVEAAASKSFSPSALRPRGDKAQPPRRLSVDR